MRVKDLRVEPIAARDAKRVIRSLHYSGKVTRNAQVHLGVFMDGKCGGALQFGPAMDQRRCLGLVPGTPWRGMLELSRLALAEWLPRNSESRALAFAVRWLHREYPHLRWLQSYADATQSGDGGIYRAAGWLLVGIKRNTQIIRMPTGATIAKKTLDNRVSSSDGRYGMSIGRDLGAVPLEGFQLRYVRFLDPSYRGRLTVPVLPYTAIAEAGASMYRGQRARSIGTDAAAVQVAEGDEKRPVRSTLMGATRGEA